MEKNEASEHSENRLREKKRFKYKKKKTFFRSIKKKIRKNKSNIITAMVIWLVIVVFSIGIYFAIDEHGKAKRFKMQKLIDKKILEHDKSKK